MPRLKIEKQEAFAQAYAIHRKQGVAAVAAGYSKLGAHVAGSRLMSKPHVQQRVDELIAQADKKKLAAVTADRAWVLKMLVQNAEDAVEAKDRSAANRALELVGKELGMFVERKMDLKSPLDGLSAEELLAIVRLAEQVDRGDPLPVANPDSLSRPLEMIDVSPPTLELEAVNVPIDEEDDAI